MQKKLKIAIVGDGNAGRYLTGEFIRLGVETVQFSRKANHSCLNINTYPGKSGEFDLVLLCVSDVAISELSSILTPGNAIIAHISGATPINAINEKHAKRAVLYPLMSLSDATDVKIEEIPFGMEATDDQSLQKLKIICIELGLKGYVLDSAQRSRLHLAAVLSHNFSNYLYQLAFEILSENRMEMEILKPLLKQSVHKLGKSAPISYQTGPAVRNDEISMKANLDLLKNEDDKKLYHLISELIKKKYDEKL